MEAATEKVSQKSSLAEKTSGLFFLALFMTINIMYFIT
jgi:hypothetical protein